MIPSYQKILQSGDRNIAHNFFDGIVEVTEKIDGSQFSFGLIDGKLFTRSKGAIINHEEPSEVPGLFKPVVDWVKSVEHLCLDGLVYHGETLSKPKHNTLTYGTVHDSHFYLYGITNLQEPNYVYSYDSLLNFSGDLGSGIVPYVCGYMFSKPTKEQLEELYLNRMSQLGNCNMEGIVLRNITRPIELNGKYFPYTSCKIVSEQFKEAHSHNPEYKPTKDKFAEAFRSEARWEKAIQRMKEADTLTGSPKDIGPLLKSIQNDIVEEEKENIKEILWGIYRKNIMSEATKGFAQWYKDKLVEEMLE